VPVCGRCGEIRVAAWLGDCERWIVSAVCTIREDFADQPTRFSGQRIVGFDAARLMAGERMRVESAGMG
jgi:hypothetical protein